MAGALATLVLVLAGALITGQALAALQAGASRERPVAVSWLAPAFGLAALLVLAGIAVRLPGRAVTAAVVLGTAVVAALIYLRGRVCGRREAAALGLPVLAVTAVAAALPFAIVGYVGVLGAGLVNDDMASHLIIADYIADPHGPVPSFVKGGYPIGPHALVAAIAALTGAGLVEVFAGFTVALAPLLGWVALGALSDLPRRRRILGACLAALAYLAVAYLLQGAFKEPMMSLLLLGGALALGGLVGLRDGSTPASGIALGEREGFQAEPVGEPQPEVAGDSLPPETGGSRRPLGVHPLLRVLPLAVIVAGIVMLYSLPGLLWAAAVGAAVIAARLLLVRPRPRLPDDWARRFAPYAAGVLVILLIATAQEWSRLVDFSRLSALNPDRFGSQLGNLRGSLSPLELFGIWPAGDFRTAAAAASGPTIAVYLGAAIAIAAFGAELFRAISARRGLSAPAAAVAAIAVWALLALIGSPYVAAKGLAIAAPLVIVVAVQGTLGARSRALLALGAALAAGAALSAFLVVRQAPVGPDDHARELAAIRDAVQGEDVLFLGRDDFIGWELRGSGEITGVVTNFYDVEDVRPRFKKGPGGGEKFDVDVLHPRQLDRFRWIVATTGGPTSDLPPSFREVERSGDYVLYENAGTVGRRSTLDEGTAIGAELDCSSPEGRAISHEDGFAVIWDPAPVVAPESAWKPSATANDGAPSSQKIKLSAPGRWLISLEYDSRRPLHVTAPGLALDATVPANLDFRGETPTFPVGTVEAERPLSAELTVEPVKPNLLARALGAPNEAHLRALTATPLAGDAVRRVPLREACGKYVDWYRVTGS